MFVGLKREILRRKVINYMFDATVKGSGIKWDDFLEVIRILKAPKGMQVIEESMYPIYIGVVDRIIHDGQLSSQEKTKLIKEFKEGFDKIADQLIEEGLASGHI